MICFYNSIYRKDINNGEFSDELTKERSQHHYFSVPFDS